ncbi:MAG: hypothetical protein N2053_10845 [Chitinispirillaceae bacterium]|nr:hypothetical protein [Chitinispirillaceae bacterium]
MKNIEHIKKLISFDNDKYFMLTEREIEELSWAKISEYDFEGIVISVPQKIDLSKNNTFPLILALGYNGIRNFILKENRNIFALVFSEETEKLIIGPPKIYSKVIDYSKIESAQEEKLQKELENVHFAGARLFDLRESLGIPWEPGVYRTTFIYYDWVSNTVTTELISKEKKKTKEILSLPKTIEAEISLDLYSENIQPILKFSIPEKINITEKEIPIEIEIKVPVGTLCRKIESGRVIGWKNLSLLFVRKNQDQKPVLRYDFVVSGKMALDGGERDNFSNLGLEGRFLLDLKKKIPDVFSEEIEYCCYLVCYDAIVGPKIIKIYKK